MVYFSQIKGRPVYDSEGKNIGSIVDLVFVDGEKYAEISHLVYFSRKYRKKVPWRFVKEIKDNPGTATLDADIYLNVPEAELNPTFEGEREFLVSRLVDKQIIDVDGLKVVRVNDVLLGKITDMFCIVAVCVGAKSFIRSLAGERLGELVGSKISEHIITWEFVESLDPDIQKLHIRLKRSKIADLHPADIADLMEDLTYKERELIFNALDKETAAKTMIESEPEVQKDFLKAMKLNNILEILENIPPNHAADIISVMPEHLRNEIFRHMNRDVARKVREILGYPDMSVGSIMHTEFVAVPGDYTAQKAIEFLRKTKPASDKMYRIYVVDKEHKLLGFLPLGTLVTAPAKERIESLMKTKIIKLHTKTSKQDAANALSKYNLFVLPVVDESNVLKGVVKADDVISEVMPKAWKKRRYFAPRTRRFNGFQRKRVVG
ncbi:MAG TPA: CBS domain-containing protein [archaeon]|nr:CBS domain-containing protein [archaeon]